MFELLTRAMMEDRERDIERFVLQTRAIRLARQAAPSRAGRRTWPFQRANRASNSAFTAGHSASTIE